MHEVNDFFSCFFANELVLNVFASLVGKFSSRFLNSLIDISIEREYFDKFVHNRSLGLREVNLKIRYHNRFLHPI